ncbi:MAG TPA: hypothetical protein VLZ28_05055, partial [Daejeonella sp.]|nr:hypothetical protein [Daejeonella sp.]
FEFLNQIGGLNNPTNRSAAVSFVYEKGRYKFSSSIIPKEKGIYALQFFYFPPRKEGVGIPTAQMGSTADGTKIMATMQFIHYMINKGETNYETLYMKNCQPAYEIDASLGPLEKLLVYTFEIK